MSLRTGPLVSIPALPACWAGSPTLPPTDRAKPSGTYALAEQLDNVNAAAKKLEGDDGEIGNGRRVVLLLMAGVV